MSNSNNFPPPDDFSKTKPNLPISRDDASSDWDKTNYNQKYSPQPHDEEWGKTVANYNVPKTDEPDFNKTYNPGSEKAKAPEWGMTEANINIAQEEFPKQQGGSGGGRGGNESYGATTPYIKLPEAERAKYQNLPPTPTQEAEQEKEEKKKGGLPSWLLVSAGLLGMFIFAVVVLVLVWYFFLNKTGFNVTVKSLPPRSDIYVDGTKWGVSNEDGSIILQSLKGGATKKIEIKHPNYTCQAREISGKDGENLEITAQCSQNAIVKTNNTNEDCQTIKAGDFAKAERCANQALDNLKEPFSPEDLTKALNLYRINFAVNKYDIPPNNMVFLAKASNYIKKLPPSTVIEVGGHTDSDGTDAKNQTLSENRSKAVFDALLKFGVTQSMLTQKGYGESKPMPNNTNKNDDEKFQNRRIEYTVIKK